MPQDFLRYVEPFAGSACFFFAAIRADSVLADFNPDLICAFNMVQKHPRLLARKLTCFSPDEETYYEIRRNLSSSVSEMDHAAKFIFLNAYCFNGVYRTNLKGEFNVPMGTKTGGVPSEKHLVRCSIALRNADVVCQDYTRSLHSCRKKDFVYLDPPYTKPGSRNRGEYGMNAYSNQDESDLVENLCELNERGVKFLLSYSATQSFINKLPGKFHVKKLYVSRSVSGFASSRKRVAEIFVRNYSEEECRGGCL